MAEMTDIGFDQISGWSEQDFEAAFAAFRRSAPFLLKKPPRKRPGSAEPDRILQLAALALAMEEKPGKAAAKAFFEQGFQPQKIKSKGFVTGYYEPAFEGSRTKSKLYAYPLHKRPADLVAVKSEKDRKHLTSESTYARKTAKGLTYHVSRKEVMDGALDGQELELVWLKDPVDAFIIHIQGSARINLQEGGQMRVAFDGKSGHAYRSIGKILVDEGVFDLKTITMDKLTDYLRSDKERGMKLMAQNPSYIFFRERTDLNTASGPLAAASVPLQPMRSLAVDHKVHTFGLPIWVETSLPTQEDQQEKPLKRLFFAHDTGSAIKGPARGDLYVGSGQEAGTLAGAIKQDATFTILMPKDQDFDALLRKAMEAEK